MKEYHVLTLWEPWATLLVHGIKKIETRPNKTNWTIDETSPETGKGTYLIHSAQKWTRKQAELCMTEPFSSALESIGISWKLAKSLLPIFPFGHIIGAIDIVECSEIIVVPDYYEENENGYFYETCSNGVYDIVTIQQPELSFGDYREGRYAWITQNPRVLKTPIPYKGGQGYYQKFKGDVNQLIFK